jgi:hypothetical protein
MIKAYGREIEHLIWCSVTHTSKTEFFVAFHAAHRATIAESNIKGGFRGAGIVPLDPECVISKFNVQLRTPIPPGGDSRPSSPLTSKTPKTAIKAQSQSEYLTRRIKRHHSSFPESIIEALHCLSRGAKAVRHTVTLSVAENRELRQANKILGRRRRQRKTRLQRSGAVTLQEVLQAIDQTDVDTQVKAEMSRRGGRRCGVCGKIGHNARTCQEDI